MRKVRSKRPIGILNLSFLVLVSTASAAEIKARPQGYSARHQADSATVKRKGPPTETTSLRAGSCALQLLKLCRDAAERCIELGTDAIHDSNDYNGDARGDQAIFDGRRSRLILPKPSDKLKHELTPWLQTQPLCGGLWASEDEDS